MTQSTESVVRAARWSSDEATLQRVVALLDSDDPQRRAAGIDVLGWFGIDPTSRRAMHGDEIIEILMRRLAAERDPAVLADTIAALAKRGAHDRMRPSLVHLARHGDDAVRAAATRALDDAQRAA